MASKIVRAVEARAKYIDEYLGFGIKCGNCKSSYTALAIDDFIELCYPPICAPTRSSKTESFDCSLDIEIVPIPRCSDVQIFQCGVSYIRKKMGALINHESLAILTQVLNQSRWYEFDAITINGVSYLDSIRKFKVDTANLETAAGQAVNLVNIFNSFGLPGFTFYMSDPTSFEVSYPVNTTWLIRTKYNAEGSNATWGILYTDAGAEDIQSALAGPYVDLTTFIDPPVRPGDIVINKEYSFC